MNAPRIRIGRDNYGDIVYAEIKDDEIVIKTAYGGLIVLDDKSYAALVKYVEQAKAVA